MLSKIVTRLLPLLLVFIFHAGSASAQQGDRAPNLKLGDAVVTGFSGTVRSEPAAPGPRNRAPNDFVFINPDGPSVRIIDVSRPGYVWDGRLFAAPKTFDVYAKDVGQVFGVALDDSAQPNIYVAATSVFGLNIVVRGRDGLPERRRKGGPGAGWMKGQFGLDLQGGPGGIYKIDGRTGAVTLFANVTLDGVPNPAPGLGNLAYDAAHKQLFVSDLYTGMIHRFDLDGKELSRYDHGVTGLGAAKLATVAFNPQNRPNIASDRFDSEKPDSWGFAPAARRVWGLAVHDGRLYYSVVSGPQIWSVGIARNGSFAADPRWELDVPAQAGPLPVSDIAFSQKGAMILAQRGLIAGAYNYVAFTQPGEPQVFRVWLKGPNDPPSPGRWKLVSEEYAVGFAGNYRNTNGGVALGYGYGQDGTLTGNACEFSLWTTAQNIRNAPPLKSRLDPGGPLVVHGVAGVPASPVRSFNEPPWVSYAVDYDDTFRDPRSAGHLGSVRIYSQPCAAPAVYSGPGYAANPPYISGATITTVVPPSPCTAPNCPTPPPSGSPFDLGIAKVGEVNLNNPYGPYNFTLGVRNLGAAITGPQTITVTDVVPAGMTFTNVTSSNWACAPLPGPPIPAGGTLTCTYTGAFPIAANQALGWVTIVATGDNGPYLNCANLGQPDSDPSNNQACVEVEKDFGIFIVQKQVINNAGLQVSTFGLLYPVTVTCGSTVTTLNLTDGLPQTVSHIPFNTTCTVVEGTMPVPTGNCPVPPGGVPTWVTPPTYLPADHVIVVSGITASITVQNTLECQPSGGGNGSLTVTKTVVNHTQGQVSTNGLLYPVSVSCAAGSSPAVITNLSLTENIPQTVNNIALSSSCTVTETSWPTPTGACATVGAVPTWASPPVMTPSSPVPVNGTNVSITVQNTLDCTKPPPVSVVDVGINKTGGTTPVQLPYYVFDLTVTNVGIGFSNPGAITVTDTVPPNMTFGPPPVGGPGWTCVPSAGPAGTVITCTYSGPSPTAGQVLPPIHIDATATGSAPYPPVTNCAQVSLTPASGLIDTDPTNNNFCVTVAKPGNCPPPMVQIGGGGQCFCPPGTVQIGDQCVPASHKAPPVKCTAPLVANPYGAGCICPAGLTLVPGQGCVPPTYCQPPMVQGAGPGQCICPQGTVQSGKDCVTPNACKPPMVEGLKPGICVCPAGKVKKGSQCVEPIVCHSPAKLNKAGTACVCPGDMDKQGNSCVPKKYKGPKITPNDVINGIGIIRGLGGGGGGGGVRGGGGGPAPSGGGNKGKP